MTKPIRPRELSGSNTFPPMVIEIFNDLIRKNWRNGRAIVTQTEAVANVASRMGISRGKVFDERYLDIEDAFRDAGWVVEYEQPCPRSDDHFEPYFTFEAKGGA